LVAARDVVRGQGLEANLIIAGNPDPANPASVSLREVNEWTQRPGITWLGHINDISLPWSLRVPAFAPRVPAPRLLEHEVSGEGQRVQTSLLQAQIFMLDFQAAPADRKGGRQTGRQQPPHQYPYRRVQDHARLHQHRQSRKSSCSLQPLRWQLLRLLRRVRMIR
jgi:hypothetical protein